MPAALAMVFAMWAGAAEVWAKESKENFLGSGQATDVIDGFRSAKFGMTEKKVLKAIYRDFRIPRSKIKRHEHPTEKTTSLEIAIPDLLPESGPALGYYIFGYKSKKLIHVNLVWGRPATAKPDPQGVINTANQLRNHLSQKNLLKEGKALNVRLQDGSILVFQGKDRKGRTATLHLINPQAEKQPPNENITLRLSYIEDPVSPDVFRIKKGEF